MIISGFALSIYVIIDNGGLDAFYRAATQAGNSGISVGDITSEFTELGKILTTIGAGVMVAVTTYMGIKYITAGPEAQAKLKQQLIGVVVSGIVIFGAYGIWQIVGQIAQSFEK